MRRGYASLEAERYLENGVRSLIGAALLPEPLDTMATATPEAPRLVPPPVPGPPLMELLEGVDVDPYWEPLINNLAHAVRKNLGENFLQRAIQLHQ